MDLLKYVKKKIQVVCVNGFTYVGICIEADFDSLVMIDKFNTIVTLRRSSINFIKELEF